MRTRSKIAIHDYSKILTCVGRRRHHTGHHRLISHTHQRNRYWSTRWQRASSASLNSSVIFLGVLSGHNIHVSYTFGGRPWVALDLPQYRHQTRLERSIIVSTARSHGKRLSVMFLEFFVSFSDVSGIPWLTLKVTSERYPRRRCHAIMLTPLVVHVWCKLQNHRIFKRLTLR